MSLNSFLQTHPYKRKDCLEHLCAFLQLSKNGTVESMRARIVDHVDKKYECDGKQDEKTRQIIEGKRLELESRIKEEAQKYKNGHNEKLRQKASLPLSPIVIKDTQSQSSPISKEPPSHPGSQLLFNDSQTISVHESTLAGSENDTIETRIDQLEEMYHELTIEEPTMEGDDEFPGVIEARKKRLAHPLVHIEGSVIEDDDGASGDRGRVF